MPHTMRQDEPRYLSYLVRMWQVKARDGYQWRASLESPASGERHTFPSFDQMIAFLRAQISRQGREGEEEELDK